MSGPAVEDIELSAWLDGEAAPDRRDWIARRLRSAPLAAARVEAWRKQNGLIRARFARVASEQVPEALWPVPEEAGRVEFGKTLSVVGDRDAPIRAERFERVRRQAKARLASVALSAFAAGVIGALIAMAASGYSPAFITDPRYAQHPSEAALLDAARNTLAERAAEANLAFMRDPVQPVEIWADDVAKLGTFLSRRVGLTVAPPVFDRDGPRLLGGRITPWENGPAALLIYEEPGGDRFGLLIARAPGAETTSPLIIERHATATSVWFAHGAAFALTGPRDAARLARFAAALLAKAPATAPAL